MAIKINTTNYIGVLYNFTKSGDEIQITPYTSWTPKCESKTHYREPAFLTGVDASSYNNVGITEIFLQNEFDEMVEKIDSKKGFWVGRYEMGGTVDSSTSKAGTDLNASASSANTWYGLYKAGKNYKGNLNYKSTMIWGSQYDQMMIWMTQNAIDVTSTEVANGGANKVYDIYGNNNEWTLEACDTSSRVLRGGNQPYHSDSPAGREVIKPSYTSVYRGSRLTLY